MDLVAEIISRIGILLGLAVVFCLVAKFLRQPLMIAYILTGLFAGPLALDLFAHDKELFDIFAHLGIILLLFVIGLSLNFTYLKRIGKIALAAGLGQVIFTATLGVGILLALNFSLESSLYLAIAITFSSTIIITKLLSEKRHTESLYGRHTIGLMLVQDIVAVVILMFLATSQTGDSFAAGVAAFFIKGALLIASTMLLARFLLPTLLDRIARSNEFLFIFSLAWCFGITALAHAIGFSLEIGAVAAGLSLGSSPYQPQIIGRIKPLRDFFLVLFFIILGSQMNASNIEAALLPGIILSLFILIGNPVILYLIFRAMKFTRRNSFLAGLTAAQVSEFGFVLMSMGHGMDRVGEHELAVFTIVAIGTIFSSSYLITYSERIFDAIEPLLSFGRKERYCQPEDRKREYRVWVVGYHRIGWKICASLKKQGASFAVIDFDPTAVSRLSADGIPAFYGDVNDAEFLSEVGIANAKIVISTIPDVEGQLTMMRAIRECNSSAFIIANAPEAKYLHALYAAGADYVMTPHLLGGGWIATLLENGHMTKRNLRKLRNEQEAEIALGLPVEHL